MFVHKIGSKTERRIVNTLATNMEMSKKKEEKKNFASRLRTRCSFVIAINFVMPPI